MRPTRARGVRARAETHLPACASPLTRKGVSWMGAVVDPAQENPLIHTCVACAGRSCEAFGCTCRSAEGKSGVRRSFQSSTFLETFFGDFFFSVTPCYSLLAKRKVPYGTFVVAPVKRENKGPILDKRPYSYPKSTTGR